LFFDSIQAAQNECSIELPNPGMSST
jgi:hypothetical protein